MNHHPTPKELGYRFPAEWEKHRATWLSYPHDDSYSWPGTLQRIFPFFHQFIREISRGENVCINVRNEKMKNEVMRIIDREQLDPGRIELFIHPTNDAWCRDHGPAFLVNPAASEKKMVVSWNYNAWGDKYPHDLDNRIPALIAEKLGLPMVSPGIVMEGGAVDVNGKGTLLTTTSCLLHENRNPGLSQGEIEEYLIQYYGVEKVIWLGEGIEGDDTNGHIDDLSRFFKEDGIVTAISQRTSDKDYKILRDNLKLLKTVRLADGRQPDIAEIPMPEAVIYEGQRLPASYANFYLTNHSVIVPLYRCRQDDIAMKVLQECFPGREITGIDSTEIIWGLGSWHCLSQQEPLV